MRRAARKDANERQIINALIEAGCSVYQIGKPVDLAVGRAGATFLLECKDGSKPPSARKLTLAQVTFQNTWKGHLAVVTSPEEALKAVGL